MVLYDLAIKNRILADGTRAKPRWADIYTEDGVIVAAYERFGGEAKEVLDVQGQIVTPGLTDTHTHPDTSPLIQDLEPQTELFQEVTFEITGDCGISTIPSNDWYREKINRYYQGAPAAPMGALELREDPVSDVTKRAEQASPSINYGIPIGRGTLRGSVMGFGLRDPEPAELEQVEQVLDHEVERGAFGISLGLIYPPGSLGKLDEMAALAKVIKRHNGIVSVHMRNEGPQIFEAVDEMSEMTRRFGVYLQASHLKLTGEPQWGCVEELLQKLEDARAEGLTITYDQYPYIVTSTSLTALYPRQAFDGGAQRLVERLVESTPQLLPEVRTEMENRGGAEAAMVVSTMGHMSKANGGNLAEPPELPGCPPEEAATRYLTKSQDAVACNYFCLDQEDMLHITKDMRITVGSDGANHPFDSAVMDAKVHPRSYGTFSRFLQTVQEYRLMPLEDAVYKTTGLSVGILDLTDRGVIVPGKVADITAFDENVIEDRCIYLNFIQKPAGTTHVIVGDVPVPRNGERTASKPGKILLHTT